MKAIFLGTNGWYDTDTDNTVCTLIETDEYFIILDAGNGIFKIDEYITDKKPIYLFISHFHLDHIIGLHILNKFDFSQGMYIYGQAGTKVILDLLINKPFTVPLSRLPFKVEVHELSDGVNHIPFQVKCRFLLHSSKCMGYRFQVDGIIITYCPDTGVCENAIELARNADLLIAECSFKRGQNNPEWPHLNPENSAQIAKDANAKKLALLHFDANIYRTLEMRERAQETAKEIFDNTVAAYDDIQISLEN